MTLKPRLVQTLTIRYKYSCLEINILYAHLKTKLMKTLKIVMLLLFATSLVSAQDLKLNEVPEAVKAAFAKENLKGTAIEWERDMENYKVEFDVGLMEHEIWYTPSGTVIKKEQDITETDLPANVRKEIQAKYAKYRVDDVEMKWQDNQTTYKVELEKGKEDWEVVFDANGKIINARKD